MKIGINASFIRKPGTGIGNVTRDFLNELSTRKSEHNFILYLEEPLPKKMRLPKNFETRVFLPFWKRDDLIRKIWWEKRLLPKMAEKDGCDIFFSPYQCPTVMPQNIPHIMLVHDLIPRLFPEYLNNSRKKKYQRLTEKAIREADRLIANSKRTEKDIIRELGISGEKISVNYIDTNPIFNKFPGKEKLSRVLKKYRLKPGYILGGMGLEKRKNLTGLLKSYQELLEKNQIEKFLPEIPKLAIAGKLMPKLAPLITDIEKLVRDLDLSKNVKLLGFVPEEDAPTLYREAALFVFPSFYEGFGLPVLEAMKQGTPVIASKTSSLPEVGGDGVLYSNPEDISELVRIMKQVLTNHKLREDLKRRGREYSLKFSWKKFVDKFLDIVENI